MLQKDFQAEVHENTAHLFKQFPDVLHQSFGVTLNEKVLFCEHVIWNHMLIG